MGIWSDLRATIHHYRLLLAYSDTGPHRYRSDIAVLSSGQHRHILRKPERGSRMWALQGGAAVKSSHIRAIIDPGEYGY